jgi:predicted GNAT superfamily acetyltransferase
MMGVSIRVLTLPSELLACQDLIRRIWSMPELEIPPLHVLVAVQRNGGLVLGAFDGSELVGYLFGFPGRTRDGGVKHCSHMLGVDPKYQNEQIGTRLKLAQREAVLAQGDELVTWTYEPLASRNAYLNLHKLGGLCRTYVEEYYGPMADSLNVGLPSDRLEVEWWVGGERVERRLSGEGEPSLARQSPVANTTSRRADGLRAPERLDLDRDARVLRVEIPWDLQVIKAADMGLALGWRLAVREALEGYFDAGYVAVDLLRTREGAERRAFYVLRYGPA